MKKIGIVCYPTFGGSGIVASELGQALSVKHEIHFISYKKPVRFDSQNKNHRQKNDKYFYLILI